MFISLSCSVSFTSDYSCPVFSGAALNLTSIYMKAAHQVEDFVYRSVAHATFSSYSALNSWF